MGEGDDDNFDGTLTPREFAAAARALCERWNEQSGFHHLHQWRWISSPSKASSFQAEEGYLSLEDFFSFGFQEKEICTQEDDESGHWEAGQQEAEDVATLVMEGNQLAHSYEFHITYSYSYKVPVLYFRGWRCDGQPLELRQIEDDLPLYSSLLLRESKWTYITHEEHPFLHQPWYMLHPCGTNEWMKLLLSSCSGRSDDSTERQHTDRNQYLPSWLSVVGQTVGLKVPLEISKFALVNTSQHGV